MKGREEKEGEIEADIDIIELAVVGKYVTADHISIIINITVSNGNFNQLCWCSC